MVTYEALELVRQTESAGSCSATARVRCCRSLPTLKHQTNYFPQHCFDLAGQISGLPPGAQVYRLSDANGQIVGYVAALRV